MKTTSKTSKSARMAEANRRRSIAMKQRWATRAVQGSSPATVSQEIPTSTQPLSLLGVQELISACAQNGVSSLRYGQLELIFKKTVDEPTDVHTRGVGGQGLREIRGAARADRQQSLQENADISAEELEHLKITEPEVYERFIQSGDAEDGGP